MQRPRLEKDELKDWLFLLLAPGDRGVAGEGAGEEIWVAEGGPFGFPAGGRGDPRDGSEDLGGLSRPSDGKELGR